MTVQIEILVKSMEQVEQLGSVGWNDIRDSLVNISLSWMAVVFVTHVESVNK